MEPKALKSIVRIHANLHFERHCCKDFLVARKMMELFNTEQMYLSNNNKEEEIEESFEALFTF